MNYEAIGALLGGLGLFIFGVSMVSAGLRLAAGSHLRDILARWTSSPARGIASGILVTGIVQSSSAVTVATIGFVNAGLVTMGQALGVVFGANIGTTMTGWLVSIVGFNLKIDALALPMVGIGAALKLAAPRKRARMLGGALAGFGLFFLGIDFLRSAFEGLAAQIDFSTWQSGSAGGVVALVAIGFLMTALTQSSSAALALILTAVAGGALTLSSAAAMVIGANIGTTTTAMLATIGATANAKRVAAAHVAFNVFTGAIALVLLPVLLWLIAQIENTLGAGATPTFSIAAFHTAFNVLGTLLMWPLTTRLAAFLKTRFRIQAEEAGTPYFLDNTVAEVPALALSALSNELTRVGAQVSTMLHRALDLSHAAEPDTSRQQSVAALTQAITAFVTRVQRTELPEDISSAMVEVVHAASHFASTAGFAVELAQLRPAIDRVHMGLEKATVRDLFETAAKVADEGGSAEGAALVMDRYAAARNALLQGAVKGQFDSAHLESALEALRCVRRAIEQLAKARGQMQQIAQTVSSKPQSTDAASV